MMNGYNYEYAQINILIHIYIYESMYMKNLTKIGYAYSFLGEIIVYIVGIIFSDRHT